VAQVYIDGMANDPDVPLSLEGGPQDRQEDDGVPIPRRHVPAAAAGTADVFDITALIAGFDPSSPHGRRAGEQP